MTRAFPMRCVLALLAVVAAADPALENLHRLQGSWTATAAEKTGDKVAGGTLHVTIQGDTLRLLEDERLMAVVRLRLHAEGQGRLVDLAFTEGPVKGMTYEGIYDLKGDTFKLCFALKEKERPTQFATARDSPAVLLVLRRDTP